MGNLVGINPDDADISLIGKRVKLGSQIVKGDTYSTSDFRVIIFDGPVKNPTSALCCIS
jgi:hypothetical protein